MNKLFESKSEIPNENVLFVVSNVGLYDGNDKLEGFANGTITITSHRVLYQPSSGSPSLEPVQILLSRITSHSTFAGFMMQSPKIILTLEKVLFYDWTCSVCGNFNNANKCLNCGVQRPEIPMQCKTCGLQESMSALEKALSEKVWLQKQVGVSSILQKKQQEQKKMSELNESFSDLKTLMEKASEMTRLADLITQKLGTEHDEFSNSLAQFGVNVQTTGNYHLQLSLEINDFLVKRNDDILTLCDLYCLYNRARGISLISPTDLLKACSLLDKDYFLKEFSSGLKIVQKKDNDCIENIIKETAGDSVGSLAKKIGLSLLIVKEGLSQGITSGQLVLDSVDSTYYKNIYF
ncbi:Vacuolar protein-sorting-associated protein 36 [Boothiomyces sp. JEL0866]|nr:Vacuolar protein-sorting-associated protein 36 [Boothiomyces sp. JEL0866]